MRYSTMIQTFIIKENHPHLTLFFGGWGMDENPLLPYCPPQSDFMVCYDYRSLYFDTQLLQSYSSITIIAWSMGVWAASQVLQNIPATQPIIQKITKSTAINGTPYPVDDARGISCDTFQATLQGLCPVSLHKFRRRICGSTADYQTLCRHLPQRPITELVEELAAIGRQAQAVPTSTFLWDKAIIGQQDRIFLPDNQLRAWTNHTKIELVEAAHYSPALFQRIIETNG